MDPASMVNRSDLNLLEKSKIHIKYKNTFLISEKPINTYCKQILIEIMEFSQIYDNFCIMALEDGYKVKVIKFVIKEFLHCEIT